MRVHCNTTMRRSSLQELHLTLNGFKEHLDRRVCEPPKSYFLPVAFNARTLSSNGWKTNMNGALFYSNSSALSPVFTNNDDGLTIQIKSIVLGFQPFLCLQTSLYCNRQAVPSYVIILFYDVTDTQ